MFIKDNESRVVKSLDKSSKAKNFLSQCSTIFILSNKSAVSQFNFAWLAAIGDNSNQQERDKERYISFNSTVDIHLPSTLYVNLLLDFVSFLENLLSKFQKLFERRARSRR